MTLHEQLNPPCWEPTATDHPDKWIESNVELGAGSDLPGRVSFDLIPMARHFLRQWFTPSVRTVVVMVSAQSAKTKTAELGLIYKARNCPQDTCWFTDDDKGAKTLSQTRIDPDLRGCEALAEEWPTDRNRRRWWLYQLGSMDLYIRGVNAKKNAEQISVETVLCDERRNYPLGRMQSIRNRYKAFRHYKEISFSTAGTEDDDLHRAFKDGTQTFFLWSCLTCGHRQPFRFGREETALWPNKRECGGMIWDSNAITHPAPDIYNIAELRKTVRYQCENPECKREYRPHEKPLLLATMTEANNFGAVNTNPMASGENVSMHWNEMYMPWAECDWDRIVEKFIKANVAKKLRHDLEPLKVVIQESFGEPWREPKGYEVETTTIEKRCGDYMVGETWTTSEQTANVMTMDVQEGHLIYTHRSWTRSGQSRLINCGKFISFDDANDYKQTNRIPDCCVGVDCAHNTPIVLRECAKHGKWMRDVNGKYCWSGWLPMLGDDAKDYAKTIDGEQRRVYWKEVEVDANIGLAGGSKLVQRISWSNDHYKETLYLYLIPGKIEGWSVPSNIRDHLG